MTQDISLAIEQTIEDFCRKLAHDLQQITGRKVEVPDAEFKAMASLVKATPTRRQPSKKRKG